MEHLRIAFSRSPKAPSLRIDYGTAGFRNKATVLGHAMFRCGVLASLRSMTHQCQAVGVCVTASHNPEHDNGVKIVEPDGGMLAVSWEKYATDLVNCGDDQWQAVLESITAEELQSGLVETLAEYKGKAIVLIAQDTRKSSAMLASYVVQGIKTMGGCVIDCGLATTPILHWAVTYVNDNIRGKGLSTFTAAHLHEAYYRNFTSMLKECIACTKLSIRDLPIVKAYCDAAGGVGGPCILNFAPAFELLNIKLEVINEKSSDTVALNDHCGAEFVQKERQLPKGANDLPANSHCFALDGDADRVVFFTTPEAGKPLKVLDGDRIAAIIATTFIAKWKVLEPKLGQNTTPLSVGVVQTAYANGGSTSFLKKLAASATHPLEMSIVMTKTGVKNVHKYAILSDVGIWFESNGHGTVTTKFKKVDQWAKNNDVEETDEWKALRTFLGAFNWCVGDAMVDALCFELCLRDLGLDLAEAHAYYPDLEVVQAKKLMSRAKLDKLIAHPEHEMWLTSPKDVQDQIDAAVASSGSHARAFVRASGTEDVCRIYAEADSLEVAKELAKQLGIILDNFNSA